MFTRDELVNAGIGGLFGLLFGRWIALLVILFVLGPILDPNIKPYLWMLIQGMFWYVVILLLVIFGLYLLFLPVFLSLHRGGNAEWAGVLNVAAILTWPFHPMIAACIFLYACTR